MGWIRVASWLAAAVSAMLLVAPSLNGAGAAPLTLGISGAGTGPGNDPLLDLNSWFVFQDEVGFRDQTKTEGTTATTTITLNSSDSAEHIVKVTAECCIDASTSRTVAVRGLELDLMATSGAIGATNTLGSGQIGRCRIVNGAQVCIDRSKAAERVVVTANSSVNFILTVTTQGAVIPGRYLVTVTAVSEDNPPVITNNVWPMLNVLPSLAVDNVEVPQLCPTPPSGSVSVSASTVGPPGTRSGVPPLEVFPLRPLIHQLFAGKAQRPTQTVFTAGINSLSGLAGWNLTFMSPGTPLPPTMTNITLSDSAGWDKILSGYNSGACPHQVPPFVPVSINNGASVNVDLRTATTILLKRQACTNWIGAICADKSRFDDMGLFSETNFAFLFGGRSVLIDWNISAGE